MEELFQTILGFIPIALFIGFRILAARRHQVRRQEAVDSSPSGPFPPERPGPITGSYEDDEAPAVFPASPAVPAKTQGLPRTDKGEVFSAWELPVEPAGPAPAPGEAARAPAKPLAETQPSRLGLPPVFEKPVLAAGGGEPPGPAAELHEASSGGFPGNLNYLPGLKRAVVLAEILGPPKGI
jgi:hypothetical protein